MFENCTNLKEISLSRFSTENATDMPCMFSNCINLKSLDLSKFKIGNVK